MSQRSDRVPWLEDQEKTGVLDQRQSNMSPDIAKCYLLRRKSPLVDSHCSVRPEEDGNFLPARERSKKWESGGGKSRKVPSSCLRVLTFLHILDRGGRSVLLGSPPTLSSSGDVSVALRLLRKGAAAG